MNKNDLILISLAMLFWLINLAITKHYQSKSLRNEYKKCLEFNIELLKKGE